MPNGINGNSTELASYGVGIGADQYSKSAASNVIASSISRSNYRYATKTDSKFKKFQEAVIKTVSSWDYGDKMRIVSEYGESLPKGTHVSSHVLNEKVAETLIVHLDDKELNAMVGKLRTNENKLHGDIGKIERKRKMQASSFNIDTFDETYENVKNAKNTKQYEKGRKEAEGTYKVPRYIKGQYNNLRKELKDVLNTIYNKIEISRVALDMGIEIAEHTKRETVINNIINKTILYVDLIVGKSKFGMSGLFLDPEPYNTLLKYTSYSYVTGEAGLDPSAFAQLKKNARQAKLAIRERARMQNKKKFMHSKYFKDVSGVTAWTRFGAGRKLKNNDVGMLRDSSIDELLELGAKYGINPKIHNKERMKAEIYRAMASQNAYTNRLNIRRNLPILKGRTRRELNDRLELNKGYISNNLKDSSGSTTNVPGMIHFNEAGGIIENSILSAMPVYIVEGRSASSVSSHKKSSIYSIAGSAASGNNVEFSTSSISSFSKLSKNSQNVFRSIKSMSVFNNITDANITNKNHLESLKQVGDVAVEHGAKYSLVNAVIKKYASDNNIEYCRNAMLYIYAQSMKYNDLLAFVKANYIDLGNTQDVISRRNKKRISAAVGAAGVIGTAAVLGSPMIALGVAGGLAVGAGIFGAVKAVRLMKGAIDSIGSSRHPNQFTDLSPKDQALYRNLSSKGVYEISSLLKAQGYDALKLDGMTNKILTKYNGNSSIESQLKDFLIAIYARSVGQVGLYRYLSVKNKFEAGMFKDYIQKGSNKKNKGIRQSKFGEIRSKIKSITNIFSRNNSKDNGDIEGRDYVDGNGGAASMLLPKIVIHGTEAVKVWIIGGSTTSDGNDENERYIKKVIHGSTSGHGLNITRTLPGARTKYTNKTGIFAGLDEHNPFVASLTNVRQAFQTESSSRLGSMGAQAFRVMDMSQIMQKKLEDAKMADSEYDSATLSTAATAAGIKSILSIPATPVYTVNPEADDKVYNWLRSVFPAVMVGLQNVAGTNAAGAVGVALGATGAADATAEIAHDLAMLSTGGRGYGGNSAVSNFISGDAARGTNNSANPEQVSIDWNAKRYSVKPIPMHADGVSSASSSGQVTKMTSSERSAPMSVNVASNLISYSNKLKNDNITDDGSGKAIKVYNVDNSFLTEEVSVGGVDMSLMGMLANIYTEITGIHSTVKTGNTLLTTVAANASTASSSGSSSSGSNPFAGGFTSSLDGILGGE